VPLWQNKQMENLKLALIQPHLHWEDKQANLSMFEVKMQALKGEPDIIVLPEMFSTGFSMNAFALAEPMHGDSVNWMREQAQSYSAVITGSIIIEEDGKYYNRLVWMQPDGSFEQYDKRHLFSMADEEKTYSPGNKKLIVELKGWKICPMVCYDLRFPAWIRNHEMYDLLIFAANWPEKRIKHWTTLLHARAIENESYAVGVNRVGNDGNGIIHSGSSMAISPMGETLLELEGESVAEIELHYEEITKMRRHMPFLKDRDNYEIKDFEL